MRVVEAGAKAPPYPADTRSAGWRFQLDTQRLRQSDTWQLAGVHGLRSVVLRLWVESWDQIPSGSLPPDDAIIAAMIDYPLGMLVEHRAVLLRGWWKATDGRLYHPVITELVLNRRAWKDAERERKQAYRKTVRQQLPDSKHVARAVPQVSRGTLPDATQDDDAGAGAGAGAFVLGSALENTSRLARSARSDLRGTRLKPDTPLDPEWLAWAIDCYPTLTRKQVMDFWVEFRNYWSDVPGQNGLKLRWFQTWQNNIHRRMK